MIDVTEMTNDHIRKTLIKADNSYYNKSESILTDKEYDYLKDELRKRNFEDPYFKNIGSPIDNITNWKKEQHKISMGSLEKVNTEEEFGEWYKKVNSDLLIMEWKLDGISISLNYENGNLISAITRGDGIIGENILKNVKKMINVKENLPNNFTGSLRGEIILTSENFNFINSILHDEDEKEYKNLRNAASGIAKGYDGKFCEYLSIIFYDCTNDFETELDKLNFLKNELNVETVKYCFNFGYNNNVLKFKEFEEERSNLSYDTDGIVIKVNSIERQNELGIKDGIPKGQIAWKFPSMKAKTKIINVDRQYGLTGQITPVAILEPVKLCGVTISKASLANFGIFESFNFCYGDAVIIERANDVIPQIFQNLGGGIDKIIYSQICPICNEATEIKINVVIEKGIKRTIKQECCTNEFCEGKELGNLKKWADSVFDGKGMAEKTIELLYDRCLITTPDCFYQLEEKQLLKLPTFKKKKAKNILEVINSGKYVSLSKFIDGLNIDNFGESRAELLIENGYTTIEKFLTISYEELINIKGIGKSIAESFLNGIKKKMNLIHDLLLIVAIKSEEVEEIKLNSNKFEGKSFCFTGTIQKFDEKGERYTRKMMESLVLKNGGVVSDTVSKKLHYLVQADPNSISSKTEKAIKNGVQIISENKFFEMLT